MITIRDANFRYSKSRVVFENLNLEMNSGHIYGLLGKNGVGKTTLLKLLTGLSIPQSGSVDLDGSTPSKRQPDFLEGIFLVPEEISLPPVKPLTFAKINGPLYSGFDHSRFRELLKNFNVDEDQNFSKMSHGQRKKALISFAIACNTKFLFLDEPTNGLDIPSKGIFRSLLASLFSEDRTIILSTHQVRDLQSLIDSVVILEDGKVVLNSSLDHVARRFAFGHSLLSPLSGEVFYQCTSEMGKSVMTPNLSENPGNVDLETLFNACIDIPEKISSAFSLQSSN
ncbi:MAG: ATP-binding cassette domain-containing protein [Bacteroidales bacterium]